MQLRDEERKMFLKMAQLVDTMTRTQRCLLGDLLYLVVESHKRTDESSNVEDANKKTNTKYTFPPVPMSDEELRSTFQGTQFSILKSLPHPQVRFFEKEQIAIASLEDCLRDMLSHGVPIQGLQESKIHKELREFIQRHNADDVSANIR